MSILFHGDLHGGHRATREMFHYARDHHVDEIIQVGDFGYGWDDGTFVNSVADLVQGTGIPLSWLDGNHENFDLLETVIDSIGNEIAPGVTYLPRGTVIEREGASILIMGGAYSVDKKYRFPGSSWWPQEEITEEDLKVGLERAELWHPIDVVLSHDAPDAAFSEAIRQANEPGVDEYQFGHLMWKTTDRFPAAEANRMKLQRLLQAVAPKLWVHGHYHTHYEAQLGETRVVGLSHESNYGSKMIWENNG